MRRRPLFSAAAVTALLVADAGVAQQPTPEQIEAARRRYERGIELYLDAGTPDSPPQEAQADNKEELDAWLAIQTCPKPARPFLVRSVRIANWKVLYNVGQVALILEDGAGAVTAFERYLELGGDGVPEKRRAEVEHELASLRPRVGYVELAVTPRDAEVLVAGQRLPRAPEGRVAALPGTFTIEARHVAYASVAMTVTTKAGAIVHVPLTLRPTGAAEDRAGAGRPASAEVTRVPPRSGCACDVRAPPSREAPKGGAGIVLFASTMLMASWRRRGRSRGSRARHPS
jgi:hypothetical protein